MLVHQEVYEETSSSVFVKNVLPSIIKLIKDVLNRCQDPKDTSQAKHILKYIFPKQFGLHNVFTHATDRRETTHAFKDYTDRENEITGAMKGRDEKVYRRLGSQVLPLVTKMQKLHKRCSYHAIIHYYCASASENTYDAELAVSLNEEKERSKEITQMELPTASTIMSDDFEVTSKECDIIRHYTPHHKVRQLYI